MIHDFVAGLLLLIGAVFILSASIGLLRFPDVYTRMHSASKAGTVGSGVLLLALAVYSMEFSVVSRALAGIAFFLITAPISAHLIARVAYITGTKPWKGTVIDDYAANVNEKKQKQP